ncbi:hypothetical protein ACFW9L_42725, partial [Streptomyces sp. NPDC059517]|uniref:hypothetical protein n=1 Tax=Streptomyces sp. NPDC059517 TaxID=3346855 RepID=UPI0036D12A03
MPASIPSAGRGVVGAAEDRGLYPGVEKPAGPRSCRQIPDVRPEGGPGGVWCVLSVCRAEVRV